MNEDRFFQKEGVKKKAQKHEKQVAKYIQGRVTVNSGACLTDKGDVKKKCNSNFKFRIECKTTGEGSIRIEKAWLEKIKLQSRFEIPALNIKIQNEDWYIIRPEEFSLLLEFIEIINNQGGL